MEHLEAGDRHDDFLDDYPTVTTEQAVGGSNGELLHLAADHGFGVVVTVDQGFAYQQSVRSLPIPVVIMIAGRTRSQELLPLVPEMIAVLSGDLGQRIHRIMA